MNGTGNVFFRIFTFAGSDTDHFRSLEGEAGNHEDAQHGGKSADEGRIADRPVYESRRRLGPETQDEKGAGAEEYQYGQYLDAGEDKFAFAVRAGR